MPSKYHHCLNAIKSQKIKHKQNKYEARKKSQFVKQLNSRKVSLNTPGQFNTPDQFNTMAESSFDMIRQGYNFNPSVSLGNSYPRISKKIAFLFMIIQLMDVVRASSDIYYPYRYSFSEELDCYDKTEGVSAGKICNINGSKHMLKCTGQPIDLQVSPDNISGHENLEFLKELDILVPETFFVYERNGTLTHSGRKLQCESYLASKFEEEFTSAGKILEKARRKKIKFHIENKDFVKDTIEGSIGGHDQVAKLIVASTFIYDIANNGGNWGSLNNNLFILDADLTPTNTLDFYSNAINTISSIGGEFQLEISGDTLNDMLVLYQKIQLNQKISDYFREIIEGFEASVQETIKTLSSIDSGFDNRYLKDKLSSNLSRQRDILRSSNKLHNNVNIYNTRKQLCIEDQKKNYTLYFS